MLVTEFRLFAELSSYLVQLFYIYKSKKAR